VRPKPVLRLLRAVYRVRPNEALNCVGATESGHAPTPGADLAAYLKQAISRLQAEGIDPATGLVDYAGLARSDSFREYEAAVGALRDFDPHTLGDHAARLAFWLNLYNALIIHAVIAYGPRGRITEVAGVFERAAYVVGGWRLSADDIEHGILRANAGHPFLPGARFESGDPRRALALERLDPRLHFALNCGAESCPPINFYDADRFDAQLDLAARHFLSTGGLRLDRAARTVHLSRIFSWYAADFGGAWFGYRRRAALLRTVAAWAAPEQVEYLRAHADGLRVRFLPYDWSLNG